MMPPLWWGFKSLPAHFWHSEIHAKEIMAADLNRQASGIRICGFLMQTRIYLFGKEGKSGLWVVFAVVCYEAREVEGLDCVVVVEIAVRVVRPDAEW